MAADSFRRSWNPWNGDFATPKWIRDEDWHQAPIDGGLPGGWPIREKNFKQNSGYYSVGAIDADAKSMLPIAVAGVAAYQGYKKSPLMAALFGVGAYILANKIVRG